MLNVLLRQFLSKKKQQQKKTTNKCELSTGALDILWKDVIHTRFYSKWKKLIYDYKSPFVISIPVLCFQIFTVKLILWPKLLERKNVRKQFLLFFIDLKL